MDQRDIVGRGLFDLSGCKGGLMIKFMTTTYKTEIRPVQVKRETETTVIIAGRRNAKRSMYDNFFDTWEEAF